MNCLTHVSEALGHIYVDALEPADFRKWVADMLGEGFASATVASWLRVARELAQIPWTVVLSGPRTIAQVGFNLVRGLVVVVGMEPFLVVVALDESEQPGLSVVDVAPRRRVRAFEFQRREEALGDGVDAPMFCQAVVVAQAFPDPMGPMARRILNTSRAM